MGYNGSGVGEPHCENVGCILIDGHCKRAIHAEENAIKWAPGTVTDCVIWVSHRPCFDCIKKISEAGLKKVKFFIDYDSGELVQYKEIQTQIDKLGLGVVLEKVDGYSQKFGL